MEPLERGEHLIPFQGQRVIRLVRILSWTYSDICSCHRASVCQRRVVTGARDNRARKQRLNFTRRRSVGSWTCRHVALPYMGTPSKGEDEVRREIGWNVAYRYETRHTYFGNKDTEECERIHTHAAVSTPRSSTGIIEPTSSDHRGLFFGSVGCETGYDRGLRELSQVSEKNSDMYSCCKQRTGSDHGWYRATTNRNEVVRKQQHQGLGLRLEDLQRHYPCSTALYPVFPVESHSSKLHLAQ